jgi:predicted patatin/cPLA2 family phospholipase
MEFVTFYMFLSLLKTIVSLNQLAFSGGGSFGAVEIGILKRINQIEKKKYDTYTGISAGGLNAGFLSYYKDLTVGIKNAEILYSTMKNKMVYEVSPHNELSILNTDPLFKTLTTIVGRMNKEPVIDTYIGATNLYTGRLDVYKFNDDDNVDKVLLLMSTSAIPVVFPPINYKNYMYADGGTLSNELLDIFHEDSYLNITYITSSEGVTQISEPITTFEDMIMRTIEIVIGNYNDPITKMNQNCKTPYGEVNMFYVNNDYLEDYNMLNFDNGKDLINIGYNYMETKKYVLC